MITAGLIMRSGDLGRVWAAGLSGPGSARRLPSVAGRIRDEDVVLVKERADIADVIGDVVTLRPAGGGNFKGLCPFHDEKTPSFSVRPSVGSFHCFGCQEGGDVISFLMKIDHLSFAETVERLAGRYGIQLRYEEGGAGPGRQPGQRTASSRRTSRRREFFAEQLATPEAAAGPAVPQRARLRPGRGRALRRRVRAEGLGRADQPPARARGSPTRS